MTRIVVIGGGKMGEALIAGIARNSSTAEPAPEVAVVEADPARAAAVAAKYEISAVQLADAVPQADVLILAVKPQGIAELGAQIRDSLTKDQVIISVAAGASLAILEKAFGDQVGLVRAMPNTPALVGAAMTGVSFGKTVTPESQSKVIELLRSVGQVVVIDEGQQDALTGVSGSGPAYLFAFVEALGAGGVAAGLDSVTAAGLARQTVIGAAAMLEATDDDAATLRANVTSPNGTTQAALESLSADDFSGILAKAVAAAQSRSNQMTHELAKQLENNQQIDSE